MQCLQKIAARHMQYTSCKSSSSANPSSFNRTLADVSRHSTQLVDLFMAQLKLIIGPEAEFTEHHLLPIVAVAHSSDHAVCHPHAGVGHTSSNSGSSA